MADSKLSKRMQLKLISFVVYNTGGWSRISILSTHHRGGSVVRKPILSKQAITNKDLH